MRYMKEKLEFHQLKISEITQETVDAVSIAFNVPANLRQKYNFKAGQYLTLRADVDGEDLRRPYSICAGQNDDELRVCVKKVERGRFSTFANDSLKQGDTLNVMTPSGKFVHDGNANDNIVQHYVGIAGGSGITPILSILKTVLDQNPKAFFTLFYGNRSSASIIFRKQLAGLKNIYMSRMNVCHILSDEEVESEIFSGRMDSEKVETLISKFTKPQDISHFYICGPGPMMSGAEKALERLNVKQQNISIENFVTAPPTTDTSAKQRVLNDEGQETEFVAEVTIIADGDSKTIKLNSDDNILDKGNEALMDLPFACKGGICCTCRAKLLEGKVFMAVTTGLEQEEIDAGFILTCQAKPLSKKLVVDYDVS